MRGAWLAILPVTVLALAGCTVSVTAHPAVTPRPAATAAATPLTCSQQSAAWKAANLATLKRFADAITPFSAGTVTSAQAARLTATAKAAADVPPPPCADPKGYYAAAMASLETAGDAASGGGVLDELGAMTPMENALTALNELETELRQTIGSGKL